MYESPFWSGRSAGRILCDRVAQADNVHEFKGRQGHAFIAVRPNRDPTKSDGDVRLNSHVPVVDRTGECTTWNFNNISGYNRPVERAGML